MHIYGRNTVHFLGLPSMGLVVVGELFEKSVEFSVGGVVGLVLVLLSMSGLVESISDKRVVSTLICKYYVIRLVLFPIMHVSNFIV